jgi:hypothetical protein
LLHKAVAILLLTNTIYKPSKSYFIIWLHKAARKFSLFQKFLE